MSFVLHVSVLQNQGYHSEPFIGSFPFVSHLLLPSQVIQSFTKSGKEPFIHLWTAALLTSSIMVLTRCMSGKQARQSMDW